MPPTSPRALTDVQEVTLAHVLECIHPEDELGPGATSAGLPAYVVGQLQGDLGRLVPHYRRGLDELDRRTVTEEGTVFRKLDPTTQERVLRRIDDRRGGTAGSVALETFLDLAVEHAYEGLFGDPAYGGNVAGVGWQLVGYPGPRAVVPVGAQLLDVSIPASAESIFGVEMFAGRGRS